MVWQKLQVIHHAGKHGVKRGRGGVEARHVHVAVLQLILQFGIDSLQLSNAFFQGFIFVIERRDFGIMLLYLVSIG